MPKNEPTLVEVTDQIEVPETADEERTDVPDSGKVMVYCGGMTSVMKSGDGSFPDIYPTGTEMTKEQAGFAKKAAAASWDRIRVVEREG